MLSWKLRIYQEEKKEEQILGDSKVVSPREQSFLLHLVSIILFYFFPYSQQWHYFFWIRVHKEKPRVCWCRMSSTVIPSEWDSLISVCYNGSCLLQLAVNNSTQDWISTPSTPTVDYIHWAHVNLQSDPYDQNSFQHNGCQQPVSSFHQGNKYRHVSWHFWNEGS